MEHHHRDQALQQQRLQLHVRPQLDRLIRLIAVATFVAFLVACSSEDGPKAEGLDGPGVSLDNVVSEAEARAYLDELVTAVHAGDALKVCQAGHMSRPHCGGDARMISLAPMHQPPPTVVSLRQVYDNLCHLDGLVLVIKGTDAEGQEYIRDFQVTQDHLTGKPSARFTVFWVSGSVIQPKPC